MRDEYKLVHTGVDMTARLMEDVAAGRNHPQRWRKIRSVAPLCPTCSAAFAAGHHGCALTCQAPICLACSGQQDSKRYCLNC
jgi:hypothetical protein